MSGEKAGKFQHIRHVSESHIMIKPATGTCRLKVYLHYAALTGTCHKPVNYASPYLMTTQLGQRVYVHQIGALARRILGRGYFVIEAHASASRNQSVDPCKAGHMTSGGQLLLIIGLA